MTFELLSMLGGSVAGFVFRFMAVQAEAQAAALEGLLKAQGAADDSADRAAARGSVFGRRMLLVGILWVVALAPFIGALIGIPTFVETDPASWDLLGIFTGGFEELRGIVLLQEFRVGFLACIGYYLGSSAVGRTRR